MPVSNYWLGRNVRAELERCLKAPQQPEPWALRPTPGRSSIPPQNREYRQENPPERISRLVRNNRQYDADDDAHQRHDISNAQEHDSPFAYINGVIARPDAALAPLR